MFLIGEIMDREFFILIVCGMGYSTSNIIKINLRKFLEANDINARLQGTSLTSINNYINSADLIITSLGLNPADYQIPVINAVDLISGRNKEGILKEILTTLQEIAQKE